MSSHPIPPQLTLYARHPFLSYPSAANAISTPPHPNPLYPFLFHPSAAHAIRTLSHPNVIPPHPIPPQLTLSASVFEVMAQSLRLAADLKMTEIVVSNELDEAQPVEGQVVYEVGPGGVTRQM